MEKCGKSINQKTFEYVSIKAYINHLLMYKAVYEDYDNIFRNGKMWQIYKSKVLRVCIDKSLINQNHKRDMNLISVNQRIIKIISRNMDLISVFPKITYINYDVIQLISERYYDIIYCSIIK